MSLRQLDSAVKKIECNFESVNVVWRLCLVGFLKYPYLSNITLYLICFKLLFHKINGSPSNVMRIENKIIIYETLFVTRTENNKIK